jgi:hypothetical protein
MRHRGPAGHAGRLPDANVLSRAAAFAGLDALALLGNGLDPPVFTGATAGFLVALLGFKMWSASPCRTSPHPAARRRVRAALNAVTRTGSENGRYFRQYSALALDARAGHT